jgi:hypothetical protein
MLSGAILVGIIVLSGAILLGNIVLSGAILVGNIAQPDFNWTTPDQSSAV